MTKTVYQTPVLTEIGSFETVTQGTQTGQGTDAVFPTDTPRGELTFS